VREQDYLVPFPGYPGVLSTKSDAKAGSGEMHASIYRAPVFFIFRAPNACPREGGILPWNFFHLAKALHFSSRIFDDPTETPFVDERPIPQSINKVCSSTNSRP
jgi:hypothetical protein